MANRVCAYCKRVKGPATTGSDTHGICQDCLEKELIKLLGKEGYESYKRSESDRPHDSNGSG